MVPSRDSRIAHLQVNTELISEKTRITFTSTGAYAWEFQGFPEPPLPLLETGILIIHMGRQGRPMASVNSERSSTELSSQKNASQTYGTIPVSIVGRLRHPYMLLRRITKLLQRQAELICRPSSYFLKFYKVYQCTLWPRIGSCWRSIELCNRHNRIDPFVLSIFIYTMYILSGKKISEYLPSAILKVYCLQHTH